MSKEAVQLARYIESGMTVGQLREALEDFDEETPVLFAYNYGDHWRTEVAESINQVEEGRVAWSAYHDLPKTLSQGEIEDDERGQDEEDKREEDLVKSVVVIK